MNNLTIEFNDSPQDGSMAYVSLTDVCPMETPTATPTCTYKMSYSSMINDGIPFACNFNVPLDHSKNHTTSYFNDKTNSVKTQITKVFTKSLPKEIQWKLLTEIIEKWLKSCEKTHKFRFTGYEIYGEFTSNGMIHAHGIVYFQVSKAYAMGVSAVISNSWLRMTKGNINSLSKMNSLGNIDYAFGYCNSVPKYLEYASKGPGLQAVK